MSVDMFQILLWGATGLLIVGLCVFWWRQDVRERRDAQLARRWRDATVWNSDTSARVVRISRVGPASVWLDDGEVEIEVDLPDRESDLDIGWYLHVTGWMPARRATSRGRTLKLGGENVRDAFPPHTPALNDRLTGRGERKRGVISRLLGLRGL